MSLGRELLLELRRLRRDSGLTLLIVAILGLGIGATTGVLAIYDAVVGGAVPYPDGQRLLLLRQAKDGERPERTSYLNYQDWKRESRAFQEIAGFGLSIATLLGDEEPVLVFAASVTANFFSVMGVEPALGRSFSAQEVEEGAKVVVWSAGLWRRRYGADPEIVNRTIAVNGTPHTVLGVAPESLAFPERREAWLPLALDDGARSMREARLLEVVGRLRPGVRVAEARKEMALIGARLAQEYPEANAESTIVLTRLEEELVGSLRGRLLLVLALAALVLAIACSIVANLQLTRAEGRRSELWTRVALGAPRSKLIREPLLEAFVLATGGGFLGLLLAHAGIQLVLLFQPGSLPRIESAAIDRRALAWALVLSLGTALLCALVPSVRALSQWGRASQAELRGLRRVGPQHLLVVGELALAMVLLSAAGLVTRSLLRLQAVDPGFAADRLLTLRLSLPEASYPEMHQKADFYPEALTHIAARPGVREAAATSDLGLGTMMPFRLEGDHPGAAPRSGRTLNTAVTPGFFRTLGIPLRAGRDFSADDGPGSPRVGIVSESLARLAWPGENPLGRRITTWDPFFGEHPPPEVIYTWAVVGVVGDLKLWVLDRPPDAVLYVPFSRSVRRAMTLVVRTAARRLRAPREPALRGKRYRSSDLPGNAPLTGGRSPLGQLPSGSSGRRRGTGGGPAPRVRATAPGSRIPVQQAGDAPAWAACCLAAPSPRQRSKRQGTPPRAVAGPCHPCQTSSA